MAAPVLTAKDVEIVFDREKDPDRPVPVMITLTRTGKAKLLKAGLVPGKTLQLSYQVVDLG